MQWMRWDLVKQSSSVCWVYIHAVWHCPLKWTYCHHHSPSYLRSTSPPHPLRFEVDSLIQSTVGWSDLWPTWKDWDIFLGVDVFVNVLLHGRWFGPPGSPVVFETEFGWVLAGGTETCAPTDHIISADDVLHKFWEIKEKPMSDSTLSLEECTVVHHFQDNHSRTESGRLVVPLPKKLDSKPIGESRSRAVRRFLALERSLHAKNQFDEFGSSWSIFILNMLNQFLSLNCKSLNTKCFIYSCMLSAGTRAPLPRSEQSLMYLLNPHLVCPLMTLC